MAEIKYPMTTAMKARAKAAAEMYRPAGDTDWVANFTPRQYRDMVRNGSNDEELKAEGWLETGTIVADVSRMETGVRATSFRPESNTPVSLP
jgi:hypothetical protein